MITAATHSIYREPNTAGLARLWLDELLQLVDGQSDTVKAEYSINLAYLLQHFGRLGEGLPPAPQRPQRYRFTCPNDGKRVVVEV